MFQTSTNGHICYVEIIPEEEGGFSAISKNLPGCVGQGETTEEALQDIKESFLALLESYAADKQSVPWVNVRDPRGLYRITVDV